MRSILLLLTIIVAIVFNVSGQPWEPYYNSLFVDANLKYGGLNQNFNSGALTSGYQNAVNAYSSGIKFNTGRSRAYNVDCGYYFDKNKSFGVGTGLYYMAQQGNIAVDSFHVEYSATDYKGQTFRQLITAGGGINESVKATNISIPLFVCYRKKIGEAISFTASAGVLFNVEMQYSSTLNGTTFDYEAIYKFAGTGNNPPSVYDNASTPGGSDWLITQSEFFKVNPKGDVNAYFAHMQSLGYSVGLDQAVNGNSSNITYKQNSVGFFVEPGISFNLTDRLYGKVEGYFLSQSFKKSLTTTQAIVTPGSGEYNSIMDYSTQVNSISYGLSFGLGYFIF